MIEGARTDNVQLSISNTKYVGIYSTSTTDQLRSMFV